MKKIVISCVCFLIANTAFSQIQYDFNKFTPLASIGTLPNEVTMKGGDFMLSSKKNIDKKGNKRTKKKFVLHSSYAVKDIFNNGRVLYNDPISEYVEKVRKEITKSDPQLASETKIYVIKSSVVNAFATNQGYIFITTGLLSQLENEAQLAFILCHELMHYKMKHAVIEYVQNDQIDKNKGPFRKSEIDSKYLTKAHYSREYETEADLTGFDLYAKTSYSMDVLDGLFDVLKYSKSPFEEIEFKSKDLLETNYLVFPKDFIRDKVDEITGIDEDTDDSESTHPNLKKRRTDIADKIAGLGSEDNSRTRSAYVVSENTFLTARAMARFDLCHTSLINCTYDLAIYQAYCLLKEYPNNTYLEATILKGLYGLTKYNIGNRLEEVCYSPNTVQGEMQRLTALLKRLTKDEMNVIALNYAWRLKTKYKNNNNEVNLITADLFECLVSQYPDKSVFSLTPMDVVKTDIVSAPDTVAKPKESVENAELSSLKNNGPNYVERILKIGDKDYFLTYAFVDLLKDQTFVKTYDSLTQKINNKKNGLDLVENAGVKGPKYNFDDGGYSLGADKVIVLNPFYIKLDERKSTPILYVSGESAQHRFNDKIINMSKEADLDIELIDKNSFTSDNTDKYNDTGVLIDWLDERLNHKDLNILPTDNTRIDEISKKYGAEYLVIPGAVNYIYKSPVKKVPLIIISVLLPVYSWPFIFPFLFKKFTATGVYTIVFNLKTGKQEMSKVGVAPYGDRYDVLYSFLYDYLSQIKRPGVSNNK